MNWGHHQALSKCAISLIHYCPQCDLLGSGKPNWDLLLRIRLQNLPSRTWSQPLDLSVQVTYCVRLPAVGSRDFLSSPCILQGLGRVTQVTVEQKFPGSKLSSCSLGGRVSFQLCLLDPGESTVAVFNSMDTGCGWLGIQMALPVSVEYNVLINVKLWRYSELPLQIYEANYFDYETGQRILVAKMYAGNNRYVS